MRMHLSKLADVYPIYQRLNFTHGNRETARPSRQHVKPQCGKNISTKPSVLLANNSTCRRCRAGDAVHPHPRACNHQRLAWQTVMSWLGKLLGNSSLEEIHCASFLTVCLLPCLMGDSPRPERMGHTSMTGQGKNLQLY